jgi:hypothetical protein
VAIDVGDDVFLEILYSIYVDMEFDIFACHQFVVKGVIEEIATLLKQFQGQHIVAVYARLKTFEMVYDVGGYNNAVPRRKHFFRVQNMMNNRAFVDEETFNKGMLVDGFVISEIAF